MMRTDHLGADAKYRRCPLVVRAFPSGNAVWLTWISRAPIAGQSPQATPPSVNESSAPGLQYNMKKQQKIIYTYRNVNVGLKSCQWWRYNRLDRSGFQFLLFLNFRMLFQLQKLKNNIFYVETNVAIVTFKTEMTLVSFFRRFHVQFSLLLLEGPYSAVLNVPSTLLI